ncbi:MAG: multidrug ABC transporter ATP-binding protein [bacterium TMED80]|nr:MAG: multidrug ABC transporter ATP-binding protein [bacterium TMED80]RZP23249.1 MAG: ABC transporter ATP-binding protein [bacterium]|tara:strand:+ start:12143 stop:13030 length:888 start_codon:yes stop_codon:yes gene_type:complete
MQLSIKNVSKTYSNNVEALKDVTLELGNGMFGLLGPNGAGKSTLMRTIAGLQELDSGSITVGDIDVSKHKHELRKVLGYLPQEFGLYPKVNALELFDHLATMKGITDSKERDELTKSLLSQTNLWKYRNRKLGTFSGGMKQRFGIAQALIGEPKLIIVDEPTAGLDPTERNRFHNLLSAIGENVIVILSTHIVEDVSDLCSKMAIIKDGKVKLVGEPLTLVKDLKAQVWTGLVTKKDFKNVKNDHQVISSKLSMGKVQIRVLNDQEPIDGFKQVDPEIEDLYFATINELDLKEKI